VLELPTVTVRATYLRGQSAYREEDRS